TASRTRNKPRNAGGGRAPALLALVVAVAALGLSGWQWYQSQQQAGAGQSTLSQLENRITELANAQRQNQNALGQRLDGLPSADPWQQEQRMSAGLQRGQQDLRPPLAALHSDARADWKRAEAEYLLRLRSLRLLPAQE